MRNAGDGLSYNFHCNALAHQFRQLLVLSIAGPSSAIKAARGALAQGKPTFDWYEPNKDVWSDVNIIRHAAGYYLSKPVKLGYGTYHMVAVSLAEGFLPSATEEALWQHLQKNHSTPMLREWMPYVANQLRKGQPRFLHEPTAWGCTPGLLMLKNLDLDRIISNGVRSGALKIPARGQLLRGATA